ncbi:MAG: carbamoyl phosphate synthase-like protein [Bacteroidetes bacterium ADurb.Bin123]|nr:MAG: carbamoyl phosphate synthase-like protein [Bacteroidetes bacterium ADurb.Bin123]
MPKILVTDGRSLAALAIVRSFGEKGFEVHIGEEFGLNVSRFSKHTKRYLEYPSPEVHPEEFIEYLINVTKKNSYDMIIPVRDTTTLEIAKHKKKFEAYTRLYLADSDRINILRDKGQTIKLAGKAGIPHPLTFFPEDTDMDEILDNMSLPFLIRARVSSGSRGIEYIKNVENFKNNYEFIKSKFGEPIIQEYINKKGYSTACILLDDNSEEVASFTYRRIKEYPINGGPTVVGISCDDQEIKKMAISLLKANKWKGVAEVEFIIDQFNKPMLLEVNPRFWMPLNLAIKSGVDFPYLLYRLANGEKVNKSDKYKIGMKYRWVFPNEILWLFKTENKTQGLKDILSFRGKNICYSTWSWFDPMPMIGILLQSAYFLTNKELRGTIFNRGW